MRRAYYMKSRTKREMRDAKAITMNNERPATQGVCPLCGTNIFRSGNGVRPITYVEIARRLGISHERVRQIANRQKLDRQPQVTSSSKINEVTNHVDTMLTTNQVSQLLNLHINTVRRWSNRGILKAYRIGPRGDRRFRQEDVQAILMV